MNRIENDEQLITDLNTGDKRAFEAIFHRFYTPLCFFANRFVEDEEAARDIVQEIFMWLYEKKVTFDSLLGVKSYLYSGVHNKSINHLEKKRSQSRIREKIKAGLSEAMEEADEYLIETEVFEMIFSAIEELPSACRQIFKMSYIEGKGIRDIASQLNISEATVKTQRQRAKKYLRERLENFYPMLLSLFF